MEQGVSDELLKTIQDFFKAPQFKDFRLGGGTSLAIKYNHRISKDIDLFSDKLLDYQSLKNISSFLKDKYQDDITISERNFGNEDKPYSPVAFIKATIVSLNIELDIIQNIPFLKEAEVKEGIPLVHDDDIGSMKLLAAADRGTRKDFVDLLLLTQKHSFEYYFNHLKLRAEKFKGHKNLFDDLGNKPSTLIKNLTPLADFNKAADEKEDNNKIVYTKNSVFKPSWFQVQTQWSNIVKEFALANNIPFEKTEPKRLYKRKGFNM